MALSLNIELKELPSYRVVAVSGQVLTFETGFQPLTITEQAQHIGKKLLNWANVVGLNRNRMPELFGLSIIEGGWVSAGGSNVIKAASQEFIDCLPIGQDVLNAVDIAATFGTDLAEGLDVTIRHTRPGFYAVVRVKGPYSNLSSVAEELMTKWLSNSGFTYSNEPLLNLYVNDPDTTSPDDLLTDFCVPIAVVLPFSLSLLGAFLR